MPESISLRELNRATLARQRLIEPFPTGTPVEQIVEVVGPLQAQYNPSPFVALHARDTDLTPQTVHTALDEHCVVKASLYRQTLHVVSAREYAGYATVSDAARIRNWTTHLAKLVDPDALRADLAVFTTTERSHADLMAFLDEWVAGHLKSGASKPGNTTWFIVRAWAWLIRTPATTRLDYHGRDGYVLAETVLGKTEIDTDDAWVERVRSYLAAFGPAGLDDIKSFTGEGRVTRLRSAIAALGDQLVEFTDPSGSVVYDLTDAPRPDADSDVPVRLLHRFDSLLLAYSPKRRQRVTPDVHYDTVMQTRNAQVLATVLVDGFIAGIWQPSSDRNGVTLTITPLEKWSRTVTAEVTAEAERTAGFLAGDQPWQVRID